MEKSEIVVQNNMLFEHIDSPVPQQEEQGLANLWSWPPAVKLAWII